MPGRGRTRNARQAQHELLHATLTLGLVGVGPTRPRHCAAPRCGMCVAQAPAQESQERSAVTVDATCVQPAALWSAQRVCAASAGRFT